VGASPSPATCHRLGKPYTLRHGDQSNPPVLTTVEWDAVIAAARDCNQYTAPPSPPRREHTGEQELDSRWKVRPGDDYNARGPAWDEILTSLGCTFHHETRGEQFWTRPGKDGGEGWSLSVNHDDSDKMWVWTTEMPGLPSSEERKSWGLAPMYDKFEVLVRLKFDGDYLAATDALHRMGYGIWGGDEEPREMTDDDFFISGVGDLPTPPKDEEDQAEEPTPPLGSIEDWTDGGTVRLPSGAVLVRLSSVPRRKLEWLWDGRIPVGKLTLIAGDPGDGKSYMTLDLASRLSNGVSLPGQSSAAIPGYTIVMAAEDDPEDTIGPRIDALGADDDKVILLGGVGYGDGLLRLDRDMKQLEESLAFTKARMVIIDPINAYMGDTNGNQDISVRAVLGPLSHLAAQYGAAIVAVMHTGKGEASTPIHKILGSIAYVGTARSVLAVGRDPDDADRRIVLQIKSNVAGRVPGLAYRIVDEKICWDEQPVDITAEQLFRMGSSGASKGRDNGNAKMTKTQIAEEFLREALKDGPRTSDDLFEEAKGQGLSKGSLYDAKASLGIAATNAGRGSPWYWHPPQA
jgi:hypothetical protein